MKSDPRSCVRNYMQLRKKPKKKFRTSTRFEPVTSRYRCDALTNWAMKQLTCACILQLTCSQRHVRYALSTFLCCTLQNNYVNWPNLGFDVNVSTHQWIFLSLFIFSSRPFVLIQLYNYRILRPQCTTLTRWNNRKMLAMTQNMFWSDALVAIAEFVA